MIAFQGIKLKPFLPLLFLTCIVFIGCAEEEPTSEVAEAFAAIERALGCNSSMSTYASRESGVCLEKLSALVDCYTDNQSGCTCDNEDGTGELNCEAIEKTDDAPCAVPRRESAICNDPP